MENSNQFSWILIIKGFFLFLLGLFFMFNPDLAIKTVALYVGIVLTIVGIFIFWNTSRMKRMHPDINVGYLSPTIMLLAGIILMFFSEYALTLIAFVVGVVVLIDGISQVKRSDDLSVFDNRMGKALLIMGILSILLALIIVFNPYSLVKFMTIVIGIVLSASGLFSFLIGLSSKS